MRIQPSRRVLCLHAPSRLAAVREVHSLQSILFGEKFASDADAADLTWRCCIRQATTGRMQLSDHAGMPSNDPDPRASMTTRFVVPRKPLQKRMKTRCCAGGQPPGKLHWDVINSMMFPSFEDCANSLFASIQRVPDVH